MTFPATNLLRRGSDGYTVFWNNTPAFVQSQANKSFTYQIGVEFHEFSKPELGAVAATALAGLISMVSLVLLLSFLLYNWVIRPRVNRRRQRRSILKLHSFGSSFLPFSPRSTQRSFSEANLEEQLPPLPVNTFWKTQTSRLLLCLFISDLIQAISGVIQLHWIATGRIQDNLTCKMQGAFLHLGDVATAVFSSGIAILTCAQIVFKVTPRGWMVFLYIVWGWTFSIILNIVGPIIFTKNEEWFGVAGSWCFITSSFLLPRIFLHYVPMFIAGFLILLCYSIVALHLRGILTVDEHGRFGWNWTWRGNPSSLTTQSSYAISMSWKVMWYPLAYIALILPDSSNRLAALLGHTFPDGLWYTGMALLFSMGWVNVLIYCTTRNVLGVKRSKREKRVMVSGGSGSTAVGSSMTSPKKSPSLLETPTTTQLLTTPWTPPTPTSFTEKDQSFSRAHETTTTDRPEFSGTLFRPSFSFDPSASKPTIRTPTVYISPLTPISEIGLAITTSSPATPSGTSPRILLIQSQEKQAPAPGSVPESPSMYSMESGPLSSAHGHHVSRPQSGIMLNNPFTSVEEESELSSPLPSTSASSSIPITITVPITSTPESRRNPDRKMSLYPASVSSADDRDFDLGTAEMSTPLERYSHEGWIPVKM